MIHFLWILWYAAELCFLVTFSCCSTLTDPTSLWMSLDVMIRWWWPTFFLTVSSSSSSTLTPQYYWTPPMNSRLALRFWDTHDLEFLFICCVCISQFCILRHFKNFSRPVCGKVTLSWKSHWCKMHYVVLYFKKIKPYFSLSHTHTQPRSCCAGNIFYGLKIIFTIHGTGKVEPWLVYIGL